MYQLQKLDLVGVRDPKLRFFSPLNICEIIVGIIALADCLGPYVLNGRTILMASEMICDS